MKHILIATDGSESADEALDFAIEIARDSGATLHVLSVRPPKRSIHDEGRLRPVEELAGPRRIADAAASRARAAGLDARPDVAHGDVVASIADAAATLGADLLVVGSRGHSLSERPTALGGVAQALVRNSPVPVTVVHHVGLRASVPAVDRGAPAREPAIRPPSMFD